MLAVIDYGAGNLRSVLHALRHIGVEDITIVQDKAQLSGATQIILPGVGAFGAGMQQLHKQDLVEPLKDVIYSGVPYLGICLGMQFLFDYSEEMGEHAGFGLLPGTVRRFPDFDTLKVPHMGWNTLNPTSESVLINGITPTDHAYFVHSYYCAPDNPDDILITVDYGITFTAAVARRNIYGVQFHPEKSQRVGLQLLRNFLSLKTASTGGKS